jgi:hypothetical protein
MAVNGAEVGGGNAPARTEVGEYLSGGDGVVGAGAAKGNESCFRSMCRGEVVRIGGWETHGWVLQARRQESLVSLTALTSKLRIVVIVNSAGDCEEEKKNEHPFNHQCAR